MLFSQIKRFPNTCKHSQCKYIYFQKTKGVNIILIPFNTSPVFHSCIKDGTQISKLTIGNNKAPGMLPELAGKTYVLLGKFENLTKMFVTDIESFLDKPFFFK